MMAGLQRRATPGEEALAIRDYRGTNQWPTRPASGSIGRYSVSSRKEKAMMAKDFKAFLMRGSVLDMAVGIVLGIAFGKIVTSLVNDIIMPPVGLLLGHVDFSSFYINLSGGHYPTLAAARQAHAVTINYGAFINTITEFVIVGLAVFVLVRWVNRLASQKETPAAAATKECPFCKSSIALAAVRCPNCTSALPAA